MSKLSFVKYQGNGNDFIIVGSQPGLSIDYLLKIAPAWCDRHFGVGADGILLIEPDGDQVNLSVINADGSLAANCGNGLRCVAAYYFTQRGVDLLKINLAAKSYYCKKKLEAISVNMGEVRLEKLEPRSITLKDSVVFQAEQFLVELANRHLVLFFAEPITESAHIIEQILTPEYDELNIGLVFYDGQNYRSLVYERGVGFTNSCGSGAVAAAAVISSIDQAKQSITICQPGGDVMVSLEALASCAGKARFSAVQTGSAYEVYRGQIKI